MRGRYPCGGMHRRDFVGAAASPFLVQSVVSAQEPKAAADPPVAGGPLGIPGPYPGRVVEIRNPALDRGARKDRAAMRETLNQGLVSSPVRTIPSRPGGSLSSRGNPSGSRSCPTAIPVPTPRPS